MLVREAKAAARQWAQTAGPGLPGFVGAYLTGSVNWLADDAAFPATSDLDVHVVVNDPDSAPRLGKFRHQGVLLEVSPMASAAFRSPEAVLANYHQAGAFRTPSVIADPTGTLTALQAVVAAAFAERRWVRARCENAATGVRNYAGSLDAAKPWHDQATACVFAAGVTTHVLLAAGLRNPTIRTRYVAARDLLAAYGRLDFQEPLLALLGCATMEPARVAQHLDALAAAFDAAAAAIRTPYRFGSDISAAARPIAIDGSRELIARGLHREAIFWIAATYGRCRTIFVADAPELLATHDPGYQALLADLRLASFPDRQARCRAVEAFLPALWEVAEAIMAANPQIRA